jgi:hypothetical protein
VSINSPGVGSPAGSVTFYQDGAPIATLPVATSDGVSQFTVSGLQAGSYHFTSTFSGNVDVNGSNSTDVPVTVNPTTSTTTLTVNPTTSGLGTPLSLDALVVDGGGHDVNVGTVTFSGTFNGSPIAPIVFDMANAVNGHATATLSLLADGFGVGTGQITANYTGTASIDDSVTTPVAIEVDKAVPIASLTSNIASTLPIGTDVPFFVTLFPPSGVTFTITGTVDFFDNGKLFDTQTVSNGKANSHKLLALGNHTITAVYSGDANYATVTPPGEILNIFRPTDRFSVGAGAGGPDRVNVYDASGNVVFSPLYAFTPDHTAGVRVATADFDGDGVEDVAMGTGPGTGSRVKILSGTDGHVIADFSPFGDKFLGGVYVAAGDVNGDGHPDLVVTPDRSGGARVRVYSGTDFSTLADFIGIVDGNNKPDTAFRGGARAAIGDINGDGFGDLVVAAGVGGGPRIATFSGKTLGLNGGPKLFGDFLAFESTLRNGAFIAVGDVDGDGFADIVAGAGPGGGPRVTIFSGAALLAGKEARVSDFFAGDLNNRGGIPVALRYLDNDNQMDLVTGTGPGGDQVTAYLGKNLVAVNTAPPAFLQFDAFDHTPDPNDALRGTFVG